MDDPQWVKDEIAELVARHGAVPPPWFVFPNTHPYQIVWRMGAGESFIMIFGAWWKSQKPAMSETQRIEYFRQWPPPPRWLVWMIDVLWDLPDEELNDPDAFDYSPYFARTEALGFGTEEEYERDLHEWREEGTED